METNFNIRGLVKLNRYILSMEYYVIILYDVNLFIAMECSRYFFKSSL